MVHIIQKAKKGFIVVRFVCLVLYESPRLKLLETVSEQRSARPPQKSGDTVVWFLFIPSFIL